MYHGLATLAKDKGKWFVLDSSVVGVVVTKGPIARGIKSDKEIHQRTS